MEQKRNKLKYLLGLVIILSVILILTGCLDKIGEVVKEAENLEYELTVAIEGTGTVQVNGMNVTTEKTFSCFEGDTMELKVIEGDFDHWEGAGFTGSKDTSITLIVKENTFIKAVFGGIGHLRPGSLPYGKIVFTAEEGGNGGLYTLDDSGNVDRLLTAQGYYIDQVKWSPDGYNVSYIKENSLDRKLYIANNGGEYLVQELSINEWLRYNWAPTGDKIAYFYQGEGEPAELIISDIYEGDKMWVVSSSEDVGETYGSWNSSGDKFVYHKVNFADNYDLPESAQIFIKDLNSGFNTALTDSTTLAGMPICSPVEDKIAFVKEVNGEMKLYITDLAGTNEQQITGLNGMPGGPENTVWAPSGDRIAYTVDTEMETELYVVDVSSGYQTLITTHNMKIGRISWSYDEVEIAYVVGDYDYGERLYRAKADQAGSEIKVAEGTHLGYTWVADNKLAFVVCDNDKNNMILNTLDAGNILLFDKLDKGIDWLNGSLDWRE